jgi:hypothetical protein
LDFFKKNVLFKIFKERELNKHFITSLDEYFGGDTFEDQKDS